MSIVTTRFHKDCILSTKRIFYILTRRPLNALSWRGSEIRPIERFTVAAITKTWRVVVSFSLRFSIFVDDDEISIL